MDDNAKIIVTIDTSGAYGNQGTGQGGSQRVPGGDSTSIPALVAADYYLWGQQKQPTNEAFYSQTERKFNRAGWYMHGDYAQKAKFFHFQDVAKGMSSMTQAQRNRIDRYADRLQLEDREADLTGSELARLGSIQRMMDYAGEKRFGKRDVFGFNVKPWNFPKWLGGSPIPGTPAVRKGVYGLGVLGQYGQSLTDTIAAPAVIAGRAAQKLIGPSAIIYGAYKTIDLGTKYATYGLELEGSTASAQGMAQANMLDSINRTVKNLVGFPTSMVRAGQVDLQIAQSRAIFGQSADKGDNLSFGTLWALERLNDRMERDADRMRGRLAARNFHFNMTTTNRN